MSKNAGFRLLSLLIILTIPLFAVTPAFADTHYQVVIPSDATQVWPGSQNPCGFDLTIHEWGTIRVNYWLGENQNLTYEIDAYGQMRMTTSANGKTISFNMQAPIHYKYNDAGVIIKTTGANFLGTAPGYGKIWGGSGLVIETWDIDPVTGTWSNHILLRTVGNINYDDWAAECEYLAG
jgi:hypothetical protein